MSIGNVLTLTHVNDTYVAILMNEAKVPWRTQEFQWLHAYTLHFEIKIWRRD